MEQTVSRNKNMSIYRAGNIFVQKERSLRWLVIVLLPCVMSCGPTDPSGSVEPLPYMEPPGRVANQYFLDADSLVSLIPELSLPLTGGGEQGGLLLDLKLTVTVDNQGDKTYTFEADRATVYNSVTGRRIATLILRPFGATREEHSVNPEDSINLTYENDPFDDIIAQPNEAELFAVFALIINDEEQVFVTQIVEPGN
ncbi:MAG TPA: hypothetical protein VKA68_08410 [bacterium]|nr:hypothetical protein [bacterium]